MAATIFFTNALRKNIYIGKKCFFKRVVERHSGMFQLNLSTAYW